MTQTPENAEDAWPEAMNYLLRTAQQNHVHWSLIADQKASVLVGASFVVFTLALREGMGASPSIASFILAAASFLSAVLAVMAIIPSTKKAPGTPNLLFFGGFAGIGEDEYIADMLERTKDREEIYRLMLRDIHQNGSVLHRKKYRFLAYAFRAFLVGLVLSFGAYIAELVLRAG